MLYLMFYLICTISFYPLHFCPNWDIIKEKKETHMGYQGISLKDELKIDQLFSLHYFEYMNSFYFPGESHPFWEFVCVDKGEVTITGSEPEEDLLPISSSFLSRQKVR